MKKIEAIIQPFTLEDAKNGLLEIGIAGLTVSEVKGTAGHARNREVYRGREYVRDSAPRCKLEIVVRDDMSEKVCLTLIRVCGADRIGDGLIIEAPADDAVRVRTGDHGEAAVDF